LELYKAMLVGLQRVTKHI